MRCAPREPEGGVTLVELLVVLVLLGLLAGMSGVAVSALRPRPEDATRAALRQARAEALRTGQEVELDLVVPDSLGGDPPRWRLRFLPDGRVLGSGVDPWTGELVREATEDVR